MGEEALPNATGGLDRPDGTDQARRRAYADLLERFRDGLISNVDYEKAFDQIVIGCNDVAVREIYREVWFTYCDIRTHKLDGEHALASEAREAFDRCVLFLRTDLQYEWPDKPPPSGVLGRALGPRIQTHGRRQSPLALPPRGRPPRGADYGVAPGPRLTSVYAATTRHRHSRESGNPEGPIPL